MDNYVNHEPADSVSFTASQFSDIELVGSLVQWKSASRDYWERIGVGGSISARTLVANDTVFIGACDKNFYALTLDGKEKWHFQTQGVIMEKAGASDDTVFFGSTDCNLYALDIESGEERWRFRANDMIPQTAVVHKGRVFVGSRDRNLYCLEAETGKKIWSFQVREGSIMETVIVNDKLYFAAKDSTLYCCSMEGKLLWKFHTNGGLSVVDHWNGNLYFGCWDHKTYCVSSEGRLKWTFKASGPTMLPTVWKGRVYSGSWDKNVYCLDGKSGKKIWSFPLNNYPSFESPVEDGVCVFGDYDGIIHGVSADNGRELWRFKTRGMIPQIVIAGGRVYAGSWDCNLYCLTLDGKELWRFKTNMSTPSKIDPPESSIMRTAEFIIPTDSREEKESRYKMETLGPGPESQYVVKQTYVQQSKYTKSRKVKSMSSGWD